MSVGERMKRYNRQRTSVEIGDVGVVRKCRAHDGAHQLVGLIGVGQRQQHGVFVAKQQRNDEIVATTRRFERDDEALRRMRRQFAGRRWRLKAKQRLLETTTTTTTVRDSDTGAARTHLTQSGTMLLDDVAHALRRRRRLLLAAANVPTTHADSDAYSFDAHQRLRLLRRLARRCRRSFLEFDRS